MRHRPDALMLFAAGLGRRMAPLTDTRPKPLVEVAGRALIDHALSLAGDFDRVVVNSHHFAAALEAHVAARARTLYEPQLLETGGGLKNALPLLGDGPVVTLNTDAVWAGGNPLDELIAGWNPDRMEALVLLVDPARAHGHVGGDFRLDPDGRIGRGGPWIYAGAQVLHTARVAARREAVFSMNLVWDQMIEAGSLFGVIWSGHWCDVGRPQGIAEAEAMLRTWADVHE
jgi:MurNAc alpha-1-phosphate uridylyltransferase